MKKIDDYQAIILDMDGTLYYQVPLRISMALSIFRYCLMHPNKIKDIIIIMKYRKIHEKGKLNDIDYKVIAKKFNRSEEYIKELINIWMIEKPLKYIDKYKDKVLLKYLEGNKDKKIIIYSDYPLTEKVKVLKLKPNYIFTAKDKEINCLKPNPKGLKYIVKVINLDIKNILYIGDREEKDGECAKKTGMDYVILSKWRIIRNKELKRLLYEK